MYAPTRVRSSALGAAEQQGNLGNPEVQHLDPQLIWMQRIADEHDVFGLQISMNECSCRAQGRDKGLCDLMCNL